VDRVAALVRVAVVPQWKKLGDGTPKIDNEAEDLGHQNIFKK
jgi:hypothetical protein